MASATKGASLYVICYDVPDDRRRTKLHKTLTAFGEWRQYSLFECYLTSKQLLQLTSRITRLIKPAEDHVRIYRLCQACEKQVEAMGGPAPADPKVYLV
jgi:CRISPR-associated protein Cas2